MILSATQIRSSAIKNETAGHRRRHNYSALLYDHIVMTSITHACAAAHINLPLSKPVLSRFLKISCYTQETELQS